MIDGNNAGRRCHLLWKNHSVCCYVLIAKPVQHVPHVSYNIPMSIYPYKWKMFLSRFINGKFFIPSYTRVTEIFSSFGVYVVLFFNRGVSMTPFSTWYKTIEHRSDFLLEVDPLCISCLYSFSYNSRSAIKTWIFKNRFVEWLPVFIFGY